jgi:hypothetical protein
MTSWKDWLVAFRLADRVDVAESPRSDRSKANVSEHRFEERWNLA